MMLADDVCQQNNIKMTIDIVGQHHQLTMTGHVVQLLHPSSVTDFHSKPQQELRGYQWVLGMLCLLLCM